MEPLYLHRPVLAAPAVQWLVTDPAGSYMDCTFGRGGHARLILERLAPQGRLIALDRDPDAAAAAAQIADPRFRFVHTPFSRLAATLAALEIASVQGVLLDLGISSPQIDTAARGFSLRLDGPLDMRMDPTVGESVADWLARAPQAEIARVLREYGEERFAARIAAALVARRAAGRPVASTGEFAALVAATIPGAARAGRKDAAQHPATRSFQAVRIHVNQEFEELALVLDSALHALAPGGRLAAIAFHSLEDRIVKRFMAAHAHPERAADSRLPLRAHDLPAPRLKLLAKVLPDEVEVAGNPRARSAVLRVAERTAAPWPQGEAEGGGGAASRGGEPRPHPNPSSLGLAGPRRSSGAELRSAKHRFRPPLRRGGSNSLPRLRGRVWVGASVPQEGISPGEAE
jgi:16S rRNA (cytosine1402-N4)-methyltransferase